VKSCTAKGFITVPTCFLSPLTMRAPTIILPIFVDTFPTLHLNSVRAFATHCMHHSLFVLLLNGFFLSKKSLMDYHYDNTLSRTGTQSTHLAAQQHPPVSVGTPAVHTPKHTCFCWHPRRTHTHTCFCWHPRRTHAHTHSHLFLLAPPPYRLSPSLSPVLLTRRLPAYRQAEAKARVQALYAHHFVA
jgi:hypothetical protein